MSSTPHQGNTADTEGGTAYRDNNAEGQRVIQGINGTGEKPDTGHKQNGSHRGKKASLPVRIIHSALRRRFLRKQRRGHGGPNWAEKTTVLITVGILIATSIQAWIYWKQAGIMNGSLRQNERSITLGTGQLSVANRVQTSAENSSAEGKRQFDESLVQMKAQVRAMKGLVSEATRQADVLQGQNAAWVGLEKAAIEVNPTVYFGSRKLWGVEHPFASVLTHFSIHNFGPAPAFSEAENVGMVRIVENDMRTLQHVPVEAFDDVCSNPTRITKAGDGKMVMPGVKDERTVSGIRDLDKNEMTVKQMWLLVCVTYRDSYRIHHSRYVYITGYAGPEPTQAVGKPYKYWPITFVELIRADAD